MRTLISRLILIFCLCLPLTVQAQEVSAPDYAAWNSFAVSLENELQGAVPNDAALEAARAQLVDWRSDFLAAQSINATRIETLQAQIETLGPAPTDGGAEPPDLSARRAELNAQLDVAMTPVRQAQEAFTRADGVIGEIDDVLLSRQADALMELGPTPLNPVLWPKAVADLSDTVVTAWANTGNNLTNERVQMRLKANGATILFLTILAVFLVLRGRRLTDKASDKIQSYIKGTAGREVSGFVGSLGQVIVPVAGLFAFSQAAKISGILDERGQVIAEAVPAIGFAYFFALWLAARVLKPTETAEPAFDLSPAQTREASGHLALIGLGYGVHMLLSDIARIDAYDAGTMSVLRFPLIALIAISLYRLAQMLISVDRADAQVIGPSMDQGASLGFVALVSRSMMGLLRPAAVIAVLMGAVGYMSAASGIVYPSVLSLTLLCVLLVASRFASDLYAAILQRGPEARDGLVPVLVSLALVLLSIPVFALIWGMRVEQLLEIWTAMKKGVPLGDAHLSITNILTVLIVFAIGFGLTRLVKAALSSTILPKTNLDRGGQQAVVSGTGYIGVFLSAIVAIMAAGIDLSALALVAGALSVGIGFGLQNIVQNFVSGIILLIERPVSEGDWIEVGDQMGFVRDISVRSTRIETFDRTDVIVPNADLISNSVINYTRGNSLGRVTLKVGVAYGTDTHRVEAILREIIEAQDGLAPATEPQVLFMGFGADSLDFQVRAILADVTTMLSFTSAVNHDIAARFVAEDIEIPFAQRDIWLRNPEALTGQSGSDTSPLQATVKPVAKAAATKKKRQHDQDPLSFEDGDSGAAPDGDAL